MRKFIFCLLIMSLAACSNKKTPPEAEGEALAGADIYTAEAQKSQQEENHDVIPEKTRIHAQYEGSSFIVNLQDVEVSSERSDSPGKYLVDHSWRSWAAGSDDNGIGESFSLTWDWKSTSEETIAGFALKNGHGNLDQYSKNNRVKSFKVYADEEYIGTISIKDSISFEKYVFEEPVAGKTIRFVIDDVYPGTDFNDTYVAEIALIKKRVNDRQFYENILIWISTPGWIPIKYENNSQQMVSVSDADRLSLLDYLPFDIPYNTYWDSDVQEYFPRKTKIALLGGDSSLRFSDNLPRLDGATAMYPLYSSFVHAVYPEIIIPENNPNGYERKDIPIRSLGEWGYFPNERLLWDRFRPPEGPLPPILLNSSVQCNTTSGSFERLINGETDIIFCYEPSEAEKNTATEKSKQFNLTPIAHDAFVFIVNNNNILNNISRQQIRDIYSGRVTNWNSISGVDEPIIAYQRPGNSGSQTIFKSILRGEQLMRPVLDSEFVPQGMAGMIRAISSNYYNYNSAIGYTFLFYLAQMADNSGVKALPLDGVAPTRQTIQNKRYPFVQTVYAITTGNESENTRKFIEWILSAQGQELVAKTGYTPVR